jgi:predicted NUDIX family NTP pyrophosphohydrolase
MATPAMLGVVMARAPEISAGILVYRRTPSLQILLAHPGGPFWAKRDEAAWGIPKGLVDADSDLLTCARREFAEETNLSVAGNFLPLAPVRQRSGKMLHAFAIEADPDLAPFRSNEFEIEWPPRSGRKQSFPEVDRLDWFDLPTAENKMHAYQRPLLEQLRRLLQRDGQ